MENELIALARRHGRIDRRLITSCGPEPHLRCLPVDRQRLQGVAHRPLDAFVSAVTRPGPFRYSCASGLRVTAGVCGCLFSRSAWRCLARVARRLENHPQTPAITRKAIIP